MSKRLLEVLSRPSPAKSDTQRFAERLRSNVVPDPAPVRSEPAPAKLRESRGEMVRLTESGEMSASGVTGGVIRNVKLLGEDSLNRRKYLPESVSPSQYNDVKVYLNHKDGERDVRDVVGWISSPRKEGTYWRGDLNILESHPHGPHVLELAKRNPRLIGLSHDAMGEGVTKDGVFHVHRVHRVRSVDLVTQPATTGGLTESANVR